MKAGDLVRAARKPIGRPFGHLRLALFFGLLGATGALAGSAVLARLGADERARWTLGIVVLAVAGAGFAGVLFHRLRTQVLRWRETEEYLTKIQRESQKYRTLLEGAADALLVVDPRDSSVIEWNARARDLFDLPADTSPRSLADVAGGEVSDLQDAILRAAGAGGEAIARTDVSMRGKGGAELVVDARCAAIALEDGPIVQVSLRDRTREREIERSLAIHERLASLGLLTAGVAHEINNPLEGIRNYLKLLRNEGASPEDRARWLDLVEHGFGRIREIVRDLLRFARPVNERGEADLAAAVERATKLAAYSQKLAHVEIAMDGLSAPLVVVGDAGRLEQVVVNLLLNAGQAMNGTGRVQISARRLTSPVHAIELEIADEGPGIPPDVLPRLFDPFFTTSGGSGLGLSVSYGIVQAHGGTLTARNREGGGAAFAIRLPTPAGS